MPYTIPPHRSIPMAFPYAHTWEPNPFRVFISHASAQEELAITIQHELRKYSISSFVAKKSIHTSASFPHWIENALNTTHYVVALVTPHSNKSSWVNQEIGFAYARNIPVICVKCGADPKGFVTTSQAIDCTRPRRCYYRFQDLQLDDSCPTAL